MDFFRDGKPGSYERTQDAAESLIAHFDKAKSTVFLVCQRCQLNPEDAQWANIRDALVRAVRRNVGVSVFFQDDARGSVAALRAAVQALPEHLQRKTAFVPAPIDGDLPFYGRVIDGSIVEINTNRGICGAGDYLRIKDSLVGRSIEANVLNSLVASRDQQQTAPAPN